MSLLQKVAQDAKRRTLTASQGGLGLARELSQAHGNAPAGALHSTKPPVPPQLPPARSSGDLSCSMLAHTLIFHNLGTCASLDSGAESMNDSVHGREWRVFQCVSKSR